MEITQIDKEKTELYYKLESMESELRNALRETRKEPGLSLRDISNIIKKTLEPEEVGALVKELEKQTWKLILT